jgi:hypothetical protein
VPETVKKAITTDGKPLIIAIDIYPNPEEFSVIDRPLNIFEEISTKKGAEWIWRLKAKEHGQHTIDFGIGYIENNLLTENCRKSITVNVEQLPFYVIAFDWAYNNVGLLFIAIIGWVIAIVGMFKRQHKH